MKKPITSDLLLNVPNVICVGYVLFERMRWICFVQALMSDAFEQLAGLSPWAYYLI